MVATEAVVDAPSTVTASWRAMGTRVVVAVTGPSGLLDRAWRRIDELERRWTRFRPDSDVARMNDARGLPVFVHADTRCLVRHAVAAWKATDGACDASVLDAVRAAGYDVTFESIGDRPRAPAGDPPIVPGCAGVTVDDELGSVRFPSGVGFDPGAIGKGLAADLVADELLGEGASGVFVSIGGDVRMGGAPPAGDGWLVDVIDAGRRDLPVARLALADGAVATSTTERRRWTAGQAFCHHVIDPRTGRPAVTAARTATVVTGDAWWAEALATQLLLAAPAEWPTIADGRAALVVDRDDRVHLLGDIARYLR